MKATYLHTSAAIALTFAIAACVPQSEAPAPTPPPVVLEPAPEPAPAPPPPPPVVEEPVYDNYLDAPQTPGDWNYAASSSGTSARFVSNGQTLFAISCIAGPRRITLSRENIGYHASALMSIETETTRRAFDARPGETRNALSVPLAPNDPLLDAMAITKGRFAVGVEGERTLYLPAWVEVSRVIEDCR
ncbi:hypothetical protein [Qipengyuania nanhaisediminis]|uniref:hypothetical protein n=1 Tax=Qipengyuania nanhaisediminis TaxID=604088 RepID=UPI0038B3D4AB